MIKRVEPYQLLSSVKPGDLLKFESTICTWLFSSSDKGVSGRWTDEDELIMILKDRHWDGAYEVAHVLDSLGNARWIVLYAGVYVEIIK
jgi:hypothetical protein